MLCSNTFVRVFQHEVLIVRCASMHLLYLIVVLKPLQPGSSSLDSSREKHSLVRPGAGTARLPNCTLSTIHMCHLHDEAWLLKA